MGNPGTALSSGRRRPRLAIVAVTLALVTVAPARPLARAQEQFVLKLASPAPIGSTWHAHLRSIARHLEETTGGHLRVKVLAGGALGDDAKVLPRVAGGSVQAYACSANALSATVPSLAILGAPAALGAGAAVERRLDGPLKGEVTRQLASASLVFASWSVAEPHVWLSRDQAIRRPRDLRNKRAPRSGIPSRDAFAEALSMTLIDLAAPLTPATLASSDAEAVDDTLLAAVATGRDGWAHHVTLSEHAITPWLMVYSGRWFDGLPEQIKEDLTKLPDSLLKQARDDAASATLPLLQHLRARGVQVLEPSKADLRAFGRSGRAFTSKLARDLGADARRLLSSAARR